MKWCVPSEDALLCRAPIQLWTAVNVECVMAAALMDEIVLMENDSLTQQTTVSSALVWYNVHTVSYLLT